ncbi:MAG: TRAM domain-containing protein [Candidatus Woesearchaeota archaeon]
MYGNRGRGGDRSGYGGEGGYGGGYGGGYRQSTAPVKVGDELDVTIEAVGEKGDGIAKKDGFVLFVPGVKQGEQVRIRVTKVLRKVGFAEVVGKEAAPAAEANAEEVPAAETPEGEESVEEEAPAEETAEDSESFGEEEGEQ